MSHASHELVAALFALAERFDACATEEQALAILLEMFPDPAVRAKLLEAV
jgi:hypothetical protein